MKSDSEIYLQRLGTRSILIAILSMALVSFSTGQIPTNPGDRFCFNELLTEDFGPTVPAGWEGDWMLLAPPLTEGWILQTGPSPDAPSTGANGAFSGSHYAYMESNGPAPTLSRYKINTPPIGLFDVNSTIRFRVLMHGSDIGALRVNVLSGPGYVNSETVLTLTGEPHGNSAVTSWEEVFIDIRQYQNESIKVEFEGMKLGTNQGDIAIDLVEICSEPRVPTMGEWGVICPGLIFMIFSVVGLRSLNTNKRISH